MFRIYKPAETRGRLLLLSIACVAVTLTSDIKAQTFTRIVDTANPIINDGTTGNYTSCAWVDYDDDGLIDLFTVGNNGNFLYHNEGGGTFTRDTMAAMASYVGSLQGTSWADYDNDGDLDCWLSGASPALFRNDGGTFIQVPFTDFGASTIAGWSAAWADYDNDGYLDVAITWPPSFSSGTPGNKLLHNQGPPDFHFVEVDTSIIENVTFSYPTSANWSDYDLDGDIDLFIGCGPATSTAGPDQIYRNLLAETGVSGFERVFTSPIATDVADGQHWSLIDYDNDGDLDAFRTNWGGNNPSARRNDLYRNDGGNYVKITSGAIVTTAFVSLAGVWADFDNDGDLDCFVTNDGSRDEYYVNNDDGTFTAITSGDILGSSVAKHWSATAGDYDNDGDLDLFVSAAGVFDRELLQNDNMNGNNWLKLKLTGTISNRTAVGTRIRALATINGQPIWMQREISVQNAFCGHSSTIVHFGLGNATSVDSLIIYWPSGNRFDSTGITPNQLLQLTEQGASFKANDPTLGAAPYAIEFEASATSAINTWQWDFGDGDSSTSATPTHTYTERGLYDVSVNVSTSGGNFALSRTNYVWISADTLKGDELAHKVGDKVRFDVSIDNTFPLKKVVIPVQYGGPVTLSYDSAVTSGLRTESVTTLQGLNLDPFNSRLTVQLLSNLNETIAPGSGPILSIYYTLNGGGSGDTTVVSFDPYTSYSPEVIASRDGYTVSLQPGYIAIDPCNPGDVNGDGAGPDISDLTYLVNFMFKSGPTPPIIENANVDGIGTINIADVTYLVNFMFKGGPIPLCPA